MKHILFALLAGSLALTTAPVQASSIVVDGQIEGEEYLADDESYAYVVLSMGDTGDAVMDLQLHLQDEDYYTGPIDGVFGTLTRLAVIDYQADNNIVANGIVDVETWDEMDEDGILDDDPGILDPEEGIIGDDADGLF